MKPLHFAKKYKLSEGTDLLSHTRFAIDFGNDFHARLELYKTYSNWSHARFFDLIDEAGRIWDSINNKTAGHLPEKLWNYIYYNIILPAKDVEFPEIAKEERKIDEMDIAQLRRYICERFKDSGKKEDVEDYSWRDSYGFRQIRTCAQEAKMEWDNYAREGSLGGLQIRPNHYLTILEREIYDKGTYIDTYAFEELKYQLSKQGHAYAKIQFNIHRQRKQREQFDWNEFSFRNMFGLFNDMEYDPYFDLLGLKKSEKVSEEEIKQAYRTLSLKHHPDKGGNAEKFIEVTEAKNKCIEYHRIKKGKIQR